MREGISSRSSIFLFVSSSENNRHTERDDVGISSTIASYLSSPNESLAGAAGQKNVGDTKWKDDKGYVIQMKPKGSDQIASISCCCPVN